MASSQQDLSVSQVGMNFAGLLSRGMEIHTRDLPLDTGAQKLTAKYFGMTLGISFAVFLVLDLPVKLCLGDSKKHLNNLLSPITVSNSELYIPQSV